MAKMKFEAEVMEITPINKSFARGFCRIGYAGRNRHDTYIAKEVFENAVHTLYYAPVVGEWKPEKDNFGGHGGRLEIDDDGMRIVDTTIPYGCVGSKQDINWRWETGADGREYFTVDVFLWLKKFPQLEKLFDENAWQSMEIDVLQAVEIDVIESDEIIMSGEKIINFTKIEFQALCILGKDLEKPENNVEPCFEASEIGFYSLNEDNYKENFKKEFYGMVEELKCSLKDGKSIIEDKNDSSLYFDLLKMDDSQKLVNETYLVVEGSFESAPSDKLHYAHHVISDGELILDVSGVKNAFVNAKQQSLTGEPIEHLKRHYKTLGLNQDNFENFGLSSDDFYTYFADKEDGKMANLDSTKDVVATVNVEGTEKNFTVDTETNTNTPKTFEADTKKEKEKEVEMEKDTEKVEMEVKKPDEESDEESDEDEKSKKKYSETDVSGDEYSALNEKFQALEIKYEALKTEHSDIKAKVEKFEKEEKERVVTSIFKDFSSLLTDEDTVEIKEKAMDMESGELRNSLYAIYGAKVHKFNLKSSENSEVIKMGINPSNLPETNENVFTDVFEKVKEDLEKK